MSLRLRIVVSAVLLALLSGCEPRALRSDRAVAGLHDLLRHQRLGRGLEIESLFQRQLAEMDRKKREDMLFQIQRLIAERVMFVPIWENGFIRAYGPRVEEPGLTLIPAFPYSGPLEDVRLKK